MSDGEVLLSVENVALKLGRTQILDKLGFRVFDRTRPGVVTGQVVALLGPSGVGKTRLLRLIAGLDEPDAGKILGRGGAPVRAGEVGFVFQHYPLLRHRTVVDNLLVAARIRGLDDKAARARADQLLDRFKLAERADFYPAQLSGGQRQRVAIAQQLVVPRTLLLMDEPFSGLDPQVLDEVIRLVVEVAHLDELNTIIVVTHDIYAALVVSDTLLLLGRERNDKGVPISAAHIRDSYDLVARGIAWREGVEQLPEFLALEQEIRARFRQL